MGKVYDALQRAEEQRTRRIEAPGIPAAFDDDLDVAASTRPLAKGRSWWQRLAAGWNTMGVAEDASALNKRRITLLQPQSYVAEQFRTLRARIDSIAAQRPLRTVAVTSAVDGDGKTMASVNLALVMSMGVGRRVVLVDCDLRSPRVHTSLGLSVDTGLAELLQGAFELERALVPVEGTGLQVLPVRALPSNPSELLASSKMRTLVEKLATEFDCVILDLPATLGIPDARIVSELCDGILFVVRAGSTSRFDVESSLECLDRERLLGLILNDADEGTTRSPYGA